ncbi:MAG: protein rep [Hyphomicrobium sp.]|jgi:hypothetical protein|uniref:protein rep n=1 Tax=Hyphomicrobium sp. TaxID=82 RepID=UPI0025C51912|nr:protein rep [Hyphomicrobium sp.]MBX9861165.1 protein rep [Hyphomicrobium sp.]
MSEVPILRDYARAILNAYRNDATHMPALAAELERMEACHRNWLAHHGAAETGTADQEDFWRRCRSSLCAPCHTARTRDDAADILSVFLDAMDDDEEEGEGLRPTIVTFKNRAYPLDDAEQCVDDTITQWRRFSSRKHFKHAVAGYVRGVELMTNHENGTVYTEVSALMLVRKTSQIEHAGGWLKLWRKADDNNPAEKATFEQPDIDTREGYLSLVDFVSRVATVAVRPVHLCEEHPHGVVCDARKLKKIKAALSGRRLILFSRRMRR